MPPQQTLTPKKLFDEALAVTGTQKALARLMGASPSTVNRWLTENLQDRTRPEAAFVMRLAKVIGRSPAQVLRAFGYDPSMHGVEDADADVVDPEQKMNQAIAARVATSAMDLAKKKWLLDELIPFLERIPPPPGMGEGLPSQERNGIRRRRTRKLIDRTTTYNYGDQRSESIRLIDALLIAA